MSEISAKASGTFKIGDLEVNRLGFGAMRIVGKGVWGEPADREEALRVCRRVPELDINFIDTAHGYGPLVSERLLRETLYPYDGLLIATKGGLERPGPDVWVPNGSAEFLKECVMSSLEILGVDHIDLWQLHRIDPRIPRDHQFAVVKEMLDEGLIRNVGLSEVSVDDIKAAEKVFPVATVQNLYNLANRQSEDVLDYCESRGIGFIPWYPLAAGALAKPGSVLETIARAKSAAPGQIALAWLLKKSPVMLPIPGTGRVSHLEENTAAADIELTDEEFSILDQAGKRRRAV